MIYGIQKSESEFSEKFMNGILDLLPKQHGAFKIMSLEIIAGRASETDHIFQNLRARGLDQLLRHRDGGTQIATLNVLVSLGSKLKSDEISHVFPIAMRAFLHHTSTNIRNQFYNLCIQLFKNMDNLSEESSRMVMASLLQGLNDSDLQLRQKVSVVWQEHPLLMRSTRDRLETILEYVPHNNLYSGFIFLYDFTS